MGGGVGIIDELGGDGPAVPPTPEDAATKQAIDGVYRGVLPARVRVGDAVIETSLLNRRQREELGTKLVIGQAKPILDSIPGSAGGGMFAPIHALTGMAMVANPDTAASPRAAAEDRGAANAELAAQGPGSAAAAGAAMLPPRNAQEASWRKTPQDRAGDQLLDQVVASQRPPPTAPPPQAPGGLPNDVLKTLLGAAPGGGGGTPGSGRIPKLDAAYEAQQKAVEGAAAVGQQAAAARAADLEESQRQAERLAAEQMQREQERAQFRDQGLKRLQQAQDDFANISTKVDPSRWYHSRDTGQKVLVGVGLFLSTLGSGLSRSGDNPALDIVRKAIDDDVDAQKTEVQANLTKGRARVEGQQNLFGAMLQTYGDERAAEAATRAIMLDNAQRRVEATAARFAGPEIAAKAKMASAQLEEEKQKSAVQLANMLEETALHRQQAQLERAKALALLAGGKNAEGRPMTAEQQERMSQARTAYLALQGLRTELQRVGPGVSPSALIPGTVAYRFSDKSKSAATVIGKFIEKSRFSDEDRKHYESLMPRMSDSEVRQREKLQQLEDLVVNQYSAELSTMGAAGFNASGFQPMGSNPAGLQLTPKGR